MDKIRDYFNRYPNNDEVFECGGVLFHNEGAALSYGKGVVKRYTRAELTTNAPAKVAEKITDEPTTESTDMALDYKKALAKCKELGLQLDNTKKATVFAALEAYNDSKQD